MAEKFEKEPGSRLFNISINGVQVGASELGPLLEFQPDKGLYVSIYVPGKPVGHE